MIAILLSTIIALWPTPAQCNTKVQDRSIFLNGVEISNAKHQSLQNVNIRIDGNGNLYIEAPHYEVSEESTYIPLSSWQKQNPNRMKHHDKGPLPKSRKNIQGAQHLPPMGKKAKPVEQVLPERINSANLATKKADNDRPKVQAGETAEPDQPAMQNMQNKPAADPSSQQDTARR